MLRMGLSLAQNLIASAAPQLWCEENDPQAARMPEHLMDAEARYLTIDTEILAQAALMRHLLSMARGA